MTSVGEDGPLYLRGYIVLEKEIQILQSRKDAFLFIKSTASIEELKLQLLQDQTVVRAKQLLALIPIGTQQFKAAKYDVASLDYQRKTKSALVLALAIVLGGMLGIVVLLIRNALIKQD